MNILMNEIFEASSYSVCFGVDVRPKKSNSN
jgi:hypothetical protein